MTARLLPAAALAAALAGLPGCSKKDSDGDGGGGPSGPPKPGSIVTANWSDGDVREALRTSSNNLRQIGMACHNYADSTNGDLPNAIYSKDGKPLLSWRVAILTYLEQQALYNQFKLDEPWDSEHNKKLVEKMPKTYAPPGRVAAGYTYYRSFTGPGTVMPTPGKFGGPQPRVRIFSIPDGTSNTLLVAEAADPVIWTKPDDLVYDPQKPLPKLGVSGVATHAVFCDGKAHALPPDVPEKALRAIITRNGKETDTIPVLLSAPDKDAPLHLDFQRRAAKPASVEVTPPATPEVAPAPRHKQ